MQEYVQTIAKALFCFVVVFLVSVNARPSHLDDNQIIPDQENSLSLLEPPQMKPWQMALLAQRLADLNQVDGAGIGLGIGAGGEYGYQRSLRSETERKRRYRACYFNPVSCFK